MPKDRPNDRELLETIRAEAEAASTAIQELTDAVATDGTSTQDAAEALTLLVKLRQRVIKFSSKLPGAGGSK